MRELRDRPGRQGAPETAAPGASHLPDEAAFDRDINVRGIVLTGVGLVVVTVAACAAMWWLFVGVSKIEQRQDRPLSPLPEARLRVLPPGPRLQADPDLDMQELRAQEKKLLEQPGWVDPRAGTVRIPIDLAMEVLVRKGLPAVAGAAAGAAPGTSPGAQAPVPGTAEGGLPGGGGRPVQPGQPAGGAPPGQATAGPPGQRPAPPPPGGLR